MTRIKLLALSALTTTMILGSSIVLAGNPTTLDSGDTTVDQVQQTTDWVVPSRPGGGGSGRALKK